jgi:hypothetical protein
MDVSAQRERAVRKNREHRAHAAALRHRAQRDSFWRKHFARERMERAKTRMHAQADEAQRRALMARAVREQRVRRSRESAHAMATRRKRASQQAAQRGRRAARARRAKRGTL